MTIPVFLLAGLCLTECIIILIQRDDIDKLKQEIILLNVKQMCRKSNKER